MISLHTDSSHLLASTSHFCSIASLCNHQVQQGWGKHALPGLV
uniref:Uncharacterized protein n=1 Tax=Arundo donax TaxID=35708 RepID=A0A0A9BVH2_ARUDO